MHPLDPSLHHIYIFYVRITLNGGYQEYFGPYNMTVGCFDNPNFISTVNLYVGDSNSDIYSFLDPIPSEEWCIPTINEIVTTTGATWSPLPDKLTTCT